MKIHTIPVLCILLSLFLLSCAKEEKIVVEEEPQLSRLSFGSVLQDTIIFESNNTQEEAEALANAVPGYVELILSQDGYFVLGSMDEPAKININPVLNDPDGDGDGNYFSDNNLALELPPGNYVLEYFKVFDNQGNLIWLAPIMSDFPGNLDSFLDNPLPMNISLGEGVIKYIEVDVLVYDDRIANRYGYMFFDLEGREAIKFCFFGNYCNENGRHAEFIRFGVDVWSFSGDPENPKGDVLYENLESLILAIDYEDYGEIVSVPLCIALPDTEGLDKYYIEVSLLEGAEAEDLGIIRSGVITDTDVKSLFDGETNLDYYHFREGNCNLGDTPDLFADNIKDF